MSIIEGLKRRLNPIKYWKNKGVRIGDSCEIYSSANFGSEPYLIELGNHVRVGAGVYFITHDGGVWVLREKYDALKNVDLFRKIVVGNNVHIGINAIIMPGVTIGNNCIIGCGTIVTHDIPDDSIAVGCPARIIENIDDYYNKHKNEFDYTKNLTDGEKRKYLEEKFKINS